MSFISLVKLPSCQACLVFQELLCDQRHPMKLAGEKEINKKLWNVLKSILVRQTFLPDLPHYPELPATHPDRSVPENMIAKTRKDDQTKWALLVFRVKNCIC